jgi:lipopolysaccharide transport system permease protein
VKQEIKLYEPNQRAMIGFFRTWVVMAKNIVVARELIWQLFRRDFLMAYRKSFLGMTWILIAPLIGIISWVFMNATGILNPGEVGIPYPAFVLFSSSIWGLFMGFYGSAAGTLDAGGGIIMQVKYPHEALLVKQTAQHLANFLLSFLLNIIILVIFGVIPSWKIIFFPVVILPLFFLGAGMGLVASVVSVVAIDLRRGFDTVLGLLMFITPVIYSSKVEDAILQKVMVYNPLTYLVGNVRDLILFGRFDYPDRFIYSTIFALIVFLLSWRLFYISEEKVIEKMI